MGGGQTLLCDLRGAEGYLHSTLQIFPATPWQKYMSFINLLREGLSTASWRNLFVCTHCLNGLFNYCSLSIIQEYERWPAENKTMKLASFSSLDLINISRGLG